jgi:hypothetical protein
MLWLALFFVAPVLYVAAYSIGAIKLFPTDAGVISFDDWNISCAAVPSTWGCSGNRSESR